VRVNSKTQMSLGLYLDSDIFQGLVIELNNSYGQTLQQVPLAVALQAMYQAWESCHEPIEQAEYSQQELVPKPMGSNSG
jgi:hypothetical protein